MPIVRVVAETPLGKSIRVEQLRALFDVPPADVARLEWAGDIPIEEKPWNVGLIHGPSGSGKTIVSKQLFGDARVFNWDSASVIDDFDASLSIENIASVCQSVGFNTIPAWMRPHRVLSNGEQFRVDVARRPVESNGVVLLDEFTSVVDRQVARIASHAVQKYARRKQTQIVAVTCHDDVLEWLQPDWVLSMPTMKLSWRLLQRRPNIECEIQRVDYSTWELFAPFHYLTKELKKSAACFVLFANGRAAAFAGMIHRPHQRVRDIVGCSRLVTLPDFQGMGFAMALIDYVASCYAAICKRVHTYPAHPSLIRTFDKSPKWSMTKTPHLAKTSSRVCGKNTLYGKANFGARPCAVFCYVGDGFVDVDHARNVIDGRLTTLNNH